MNRLTPDILIIGGGAAGLSSALAASAKKGVGVTLVDDNARLGGQIWRAEMGKTKSPDAAKLIAAVEAGQINIVNNAQVFSALGKNFLMAETPDGTAEFEYEKLIIATGARERFLPFPGGRCQTFSVPAACRRSSKAGYRLKINVSSSPAPGLCCSLSLNI